MINLSIRILAFIGLLLIIFTSGFNWQNAFLLLMVAAFFIGKPWYSYVGKNRD
ncbi:hypothetical protein [Planococcus dechangensis]|uniref:DUF2892 domain-containing protein n=1 Tax=Planococcus dechangensis TaxID=1176255 RepID=A0ABV9M922_9BACL